MTDSMCPHCGKRFTPMETGGVVSWLIPDHAYLDVIEGGLCPGSGQAPRNPESDRRPLWKDLQPGDDERLTFAEPMQPHAEPTAFDRVERLCDQWERTAPPLPPDARHLLRRLVRQIVLDAARLCDLRAQPEAKPMSLRNEARKCASAVRHFLLCGPGETVCLHCDGEGCECCGQKGICKQGG